MLMLIFCGMAAGMLSCRRGRHLNVKSLKIHAMKILIDWLTCRIQRIRITETSGSDWGTS